MTVVAVLCIIAGMGLEWLVPGSVGSMVVTAGLICVLAAPHVVLLELAASRWRTHPRLAAFAIAAVAVSLGGSLVALRR